MCYSVILNIESHCISIVKTKILFYSLVASMVTLMVIFFWLGLMVGFWFSLNWCFMRFLCGFGFGFGFGLMVWWVVLGYVGVTMCWWWHGGGVVAMGVTVCWTFWFYLLWPVLEVKGEREEKEEKKRNSKKMNKIEYWNKMGKNRVLGCWVYCKII